MYQRIKFELELKELINDINIDEKCIFEYFDYIKYGEYGVALEYLCDILHEYDIEINQSVFNKIYKKCMEMKFEKSYYENLKVAQEHI